VRTAGLSAAIFATVELPAGRRLVIDKEGNAIGRVRLFTLDRLTFVLDSSAHVWSMNYYYYN